MKLAPDTLKNYAGFIVELKERIAAARLSAARAVNRDLVLLYWDIGHGIVDRQSRFGWGESVVERLARDLQAAFPAGRGFSRQNLWRMRQFYLDHSNPDFLRQLGSMLAAKATPDLPEYLSQAVRDLAKSESKVRTSAILSQAVRELLAAIPWGHHVNVLAPLTDPAARIYYLLAAARFGWSRNVLLNQIKAGAHERSLKGGKAHNFPAALPGHLAEQAEEALKSSYNLEFLGLGRAVRERELEDRLTEWLRDFILELGYGFCFVGRQHRLVLGKKEYFVDLLFYHRFLKSLVAIDLKVGPFEPEFSGKMDFYLNLLNAKERAPDDRPSLGIILCAEKDNLEVEFALKTKANPIGVAEYKLQPKLPAELRGKLPTARQITDAIRPVLPGPHSP